MIARRYLVSQQRVSLISAITGISIAGMALGVAALIVVLSVMNGFYDVVRDLLITLDPHVRITSADQTHIAQDAAAADLVDIALRLPQVEEAAPYVEGKALLLHEFGGETNRVVVVRGIAQGGRLRGADAVFGRFDLEQQEGKPGLVMGAGVGQRMGLVPPDSSTPGGEVILVSASGVERMLTRLFGIPPLTRFEVRGLYRLQDTYDNTHVFIAISEAQRLFNAAGAVSGIELWLSNAEQADAVKRELKAQLDDTKYTVETWYDLQRSLYEVMRLEKWGASVVLVLISVVAAFNIVGSLTMVVIEKRRDVGVLRAMGVTGRDVRRIFLTEGTLIGGLGAGIGFAVGLGLTLLQKHFAIVPLMGAESFLIEAYPVSIRMLDLVLIGAVSFGICVLAAVYPARRASAVEPARAIQMDR